MKKVKAGIIGLGLIGRSHMDAIRRIGFAELAAVTDANRMLAREKAEEYCVPKCYDTVDELLQDEDITVVHNCTPNNLHFEINEKIIKAGKHVFSEKPLAKTSDESAKILELLKSNTSIVGGVNFNYRMNPLVQEMKHKVKNGEIGAPRLIHGSYLQDWLLYDTDYNWRLEPEINGPSTAIADIGSHWMDAAQVITGGRIVEVCADLVTVIPVRKKLIARNKANEANANEEYEEKVMKTEEYGAVMFRTDNGVAGVFHVSQVSAGRGCYLNLEIDGSKASMYWNQETPDQMWMGFRNKENRLLMRNPDFISEDAKQYTGLPAGHPEGWNDGFRSSIFSFYKFIADGKRLGKDSCDFATFDDGHYIMRLIEAILNSSSHKRWTRLDKAGT